MLLAAGDPDPLVPSLRMTLNFLLFILVAVWGFLRVPRPDPSGRS
jgi:hypothetical protein